MFNQNKNVATTTKSPLLGMYRFIHILIKMTLKEFIKNLKQFVKENPETLEMQVVTSINDEGNGYNLVQFTPSKGIFEDKEFISSDGYEEEERESSETNAVCVN
jgi:hypothetical protein